MHVRVSGIGAHQDYGTLELSCKLLDGGGSAERCTLFLVPDDENFIVTLLETLSQFPFIVPFAEAESDLHVIAQAIFIGLTHFPIFCGNKVRSDRGGLGLFRVSNTTSLLSM